MSDALNTVNLCSICFHQKKCEVEGKTGGLVTKCDDFKLDLTAVRKLNPFADVGTGNPDEGCSANSEPAGRSMGLCLFCSKRKMCQLPRPEGGIWHCEDFNQ